MHNCSVSRHNTADRYPDPSRVEYKYVYMMHARCCIGGTRSLQTLGSYSTSLVTPSSVGRFHRRLFSMPSLPLPSRLCLLPRTVCVRRPTPRLQYVHQANPVTLEQRPRAELLVSHCCSMQPSTSSFVLSHAMAAPSSLALSRRLCNTSQIAAQEIVQVKRATHPIATRSVAVLDRSE